MPQMSEGGEFKLRLHYCRAWHERSDLMQALEHLIALDRGLGSSLDEAVGIVQEVFTGATRIWDDFGALTARAGPDLLLELGVNRGSLLAGRILRQGTELAPETMRAITNIGNDLDEISDIGKLSDEAAEGLGRVTNDMGESQTRQLIEQAECALGNAMVKPAPTYPFMVLFDPPIASAQGNFNCVLLEKFLEVVNTEGLDDWSKDAYSGLINVILRSDKETAIRIIRLLDQDLGVSSNVIQDTFSLLKTHTRAWTDEAIKGVARTVDKGGRDIAEGIMKQHGALGSVSSEYVFKMLNDFIAADVPTGTPGELQTLLRFVSGQASNEKRNNYIGAIFELRFGVDGIGTSKIARFQDYPDGSKGVDIITNDEIPRYIDLKSIKKYNSRRTEIVRQFQKNTGVAEDGTILPTQPRYPNQVTEHIFRGKYDKRTADRLCRVAQAAIDTGLWTPDMFNAYKITFLNWPEVPLPGETDPLPDLSTAVEYKCKDGVAIEIEKN
jgi:hypothetical protein